MQPVQDIPPPYDLATQNAAKGAPPSSPIKRRPSCGKSDVYQQTPPIMQAGPCYAPQEGTSTTVHHHYVNPLTREHIVSVLPPNAPEMICLQQGHVKQTRFGLLGTLAAVFWFPLGIALCLLDRRVTCQRCGRVFEDGVTCG